MNFEAILLSIIVALALFAGGCLLSVWLERRRWRKTSVLSRIPAAPAPARRKERHPPHVPALVFSADTPAMLGLRGNVTVAERPSVRRAAVTISEADRQTNHRMF